MVVTASMNPVFVWLAANAVAVLAENLRDPAGAAFCARAEESSPLPQPCAIDPYVGSHVIYEDDFTRVWNFTLLPGEMTSMHRHDYDYTFLAVVPTRLAVWGSTGDYLFSFDAKGSLSFSVNGAYLEPSADTKLPWQVPRIHVARNVGKDVYRELLFESKVTTNRTHEHVQAAKKALGLRATEL
mmetsp:Transcript_96304/g.171090  ORF Transcript_96304/g.171090 Transcript_96304/m.171090 type:complete len:184 (-) Transcript_96304:59-610(-)